MYQDLQEMTNVLVDVITEAETIADVMTENQDRQEKKRSLHSF
jgi:hypothetical protein